MNKAETTNPARVTAVIGSYRKGGIIDQAVDEVLLSAREEGAATAKIYLIDKDIEFCTNCRACTQHRGAERGKCPLTDDMTDILDEIERSDALILASPMNFGTVTAVMKRFIERLLCYACWPWGTNAPEIRTRQKKRRAVIVCSAAAPVLWARLSSRMVSLLKSASNLLGARVVGVLFIGLAAREEKQRLGRRERARRLGKKVTTGRQR